MKVAVVGATGAVGETILRLLEERNLPVDALGTFASRRARGRGTLSRQRARRAARHRAKHCAATTSCFLPAARMPANATRGRSSRSGSVVIDNSATFRLERGVPLIVPEINADAMRAEHRLFPVAQLHGDRAVHGASPDSRRRRFADG